MNQLAQPYPHSKQSQDWCNCCQKLASCMVGFGQDAIRKRNGYIYEVSDNDDDLENSKFKTLYYGAPKNEPL
uniref:Uncharacterized protein n=1 Tax=Physcomitrium patens TaxID=3218 RepID=A0A2K1J3F2_PHYPA|nr:hypothetical protein PHYPA_021898 [Physcomitrium patens]